MLLMGDNRIHGAAVGVHRVLTVMLTDEWHNDVDAGGLNVGEEWQNVIDDRHLVETVE